MCRSRKKICCNTSLTVYVTQVVLCFWHTDALTLCLGIRDARWWTFRYTKALQKVHHCEWLVRSVTNCQYLCIMQDKWSHLQITHTENAWAEKFETFWQVNEWEECVEDLRTVSTHQESQKLQVNGIEMCMKVMALHNFRGSLFRYGFTARASRFLFLSRVCWLIAFNAKLQFSTVCGTGKVQNFFFPTNQSISQSFNTFELHFRFVCLFHWFYSCVLIVCDNCSHAHCSHFLI